MPTNPSHAARLARALAKVTDLSYAQALERVKRGHDAGLLPARLDDAGMARALEILRSGGIDSPSSDVASAWTHCAAGRLWSRARAAGFSNLVVSSHHDAVAYRAGSGLRHTLSSALSADDLERALLELAPGAEPIEVGGRFARAAGDLFAGDRGARRLVEISHSANYLGLYLGPDEPVRCGGLGIPDELRGALESSCGLIHVGGPTGSGKSTVVASMVRHLVEAGRGPIVMLDDHPLYDLAGRHPDVTQVVVTEREHVHAALKKAAVGRPNVVVMDGTLLSSIETVAEVLAIAEHSLVVATSYAYNADSFVSRVLSAPLPSERTAWFEALARVLLVVSSQTLVPDEAGRRIEFDVASGDALRGVLERYR